MSENAVEASEVTLAYEGHTAVTASSFEIPRGCLTAIIGPNGSGKSTMLHAIAGTLEPASGRLTVLGSTKLPRRRVSYVLQSINVPVGVPITVQEAVAMGQYAELGWFRLRTKAQRQAVEDAMERLEITHLAKRHLTELSGGQRQRVHVAQGIVQEHDILLLDEPLTGLDIVSAKTIDEIVHSEKDHGCTVIMTTHDLAEARAADRVVLMCGHVLAAGRPDEVLTRNNLETAYGLGALHEHKDPFVDDPKHQSHTHEH